MRVSDAADGMTTLGVMATGVPPVSVSGAAVGARILLSLNEIVGAEPVTVSDAPAGL